MIISKLARMTHAKMVAQRRYVTYWDLEITTEKDSCHNLSLLKLFFIMLVVVYSSWEYYSSIVYFFVSVSDHLSVLDLCNFVHFITRKPLSINFSLGKNLWIWILMVLCYELSEKCFSLVLFFPSGLDNAVLLTVMSILRDFWGFCSQILCLELA